VVNLNPRPLHGTSILGFRLYLYDLASQPWRSEGKIRSEHRLWGLYVDN
jgi:hypothetical protein